MVYYFSGTGNSEFVARKIAQYTSDECSFIPEVFSNMQSDIQVAADEVIGVVCPIYAWGVPECVANFLQHVKVDKKAYAYIVATCGSSAGGALRAIEKVFPYNSAYSVRMPENCTALFKTDSEELQREKINVARQLLPRIAQGILARTEAYDVKEGFEASLKTAVVNPLFTAFFMRTSRFKVSDECTGCASCAESCPFGIIEMQDNRPQWKSDRCQMCMRCVMVCPVRALKLGMSSHHEVYMFQDNMAQREVIHEVKEEHEAGQEWGEGRVGEEREGTQGAPSAAWKASWDGASGQSATGQGQEETELGQEAQGATAHWQGEMTQGTTVPGQEDTAFSQAAVSREDAVKAALQDVELMERSLSRLKARLAALQK